MKSRSGLDQPEQASRPEIVVASDRQLLVSEGEHSHAALVAAGMIKPSERILVLGEGEHSYEALLVAEEIERKGGVEIGSASGREGVCQYVSIAVVAVELKKQKDDNK